MTSPFCIGSFFTIKLILFIDLIIFKTSLNWKLLPPDIFKIWKGEEEKQIIKKLKKYFEKVEYFKPKSSRQESSEIFIIAKEYNRNE